MHYWPLWFSLAGIGLPIGIVKFLLWRDDRKEKRHNAECLRSVDRWQQGQGDTL